MYTDFDETTDIVVKKLMHSLLLTKYPFWHKYFIHIYNTYQTILNYSFNDDRQLF